MLKLRYIDNFNPFEWDGLECPLCGTADFTSVGHTGVYCDLCNARFVIRDTAGDPGCVIDCFCTQEQGGHVYAPAHYCEACEKEHGYQTTTGSFFDWQEDKSCPVNLNHGLMKREERCYRPWDAKRFGMERFCLILKIGDYVSGWSYGDRMDKKSPFSPTQRDWDAYQETLGEVRDLRRSSNVTAGREYDIAAAV